MYKNITLMMSIGPHLRSTHSIQKAHSHRVQFQLIR